MIYSITFRLSRGYEWQVRGKRAPLCDLSDCNLRALIYIYVCICVYTYMMHSLVVSRGGAVDCSFCEQPLRKGGELVPVVQAGQGEQRG